MSQTQHDPDGTNDGYSLWRGHAYRYGTPAPESDGVDGKPHPQLPQPLPKRRFNAAAFFLPFAVVIGALAVLMESTLHPLAMIYADPLPHYGYLLAYILAILAPLWVNHVLKTPTAPPSHVAVAVAGNALSLLVAGMMSLALLPVSPFGVILSFFGIGLLALSPYFVFAVSFHQMFRLRAQICESGVPVGRAALLGTAATVFATGLALFVHPVVSGSLLAPSLKEGLSAAQEHSAAARLHAVGGDNALLILCYRTRLPLWESAGALLGGGVDDGRGSAFDLDTGMRTSNLSVKRARRLYYLMTGDSYAKATVPWTVANNNSESWITDVAREEVGGERVGRPAPGLSLREKQGRTTLDTATATGVCDWTMTFANTSNTANEARAEILLPPGAAAHQVSLWINGVEKPAAFGPQATVRRAYQEVAVVQRRDPLLVTMPVPGKLLVQCFPVPAHGTMKIRLGVTFPLQPDASDRRKLSYALPAWGGTNFGNAGVLADALPVTDLATGKAPIPPLRLPKGAAWNEKAAVRKPVNLVVALDGSSAMAGVFGAREQAALREALQTLPTGSTVRYAATNRSIQSDMSGLLRFQAGQDNVPTLTKIVRSELGDSAIVLYLHAGTPDSVSDPAPLAEAVKRLSRTQESRPRFVSLLLKPDAHDTIGDRLAMQGNTRAVSVTLYPSASDAITTTVESLVRGTEFLTPNTQKTTARTERLAAYRDALAIWYRYNNFGPEALAAARVVARQRLVTPLSGAVVLESREDYKKHGLSDGTEEKDADPAAKTSDESKKADDSFVAPEPGTWVLVGLGVGYWVYGVGRKRMKSEAGRG